MSRSAHFLGATSGTTDSREANSAAGAQFFITETGGPGLERRVDLFPSDAIASIADMDGVQRGASLGDFCPRSLSEKRLVRRQRCSRAGSFERRLRRRNPVVMGPC
jgi:hypothetical protein